MGAKTWMLVYASENVGDVLKATSQLDRDATFELGRRLFSREKLEPIGDGALVHVSTRR